MIENTQPTSRGAAGIQTESVGGEGSSKVHALSLWDLLWALAKDGGYNSEDAQVEVLGPLGFQELPMLAEVLTKSSLAEEPSRSPRWLRGSWGREKSSIGEFLLGPGASQFRRPQRGVRGPGHNGPVWFISQEPGLSAQHVGLGSRLPEG